MDTVSQAIKAKDSAKFTESYGQLTATCNACHQSANVGLVVIQAPEELAIRQPGLPSAETVEPDLDDRRHRHARHQHLGQPADGVPRLPAPRAHQLRRAGRASRLSSAPSSSSRRRWLDEAPTPTSSRSASSCRARRAARSASRSACCAPACRARSRRGSASPLPSAIAMIAVRLRRRRVRRPRGTRLAARPEDRRGRGGGAGGVGHGDATSAPTASARRLRSAAAVLVLAVPSALGQVGAIVAGGLIGWCFLPRRGDRPLTPRCRCASAARRSIVRVVLFFVLLVGLPLLVGRDRQPHARDCSTRSIAPARWCSAAATSCCRCCRQPVVPPGWVGNDAFLAGYGAAQAVPGPLFTFAAYLGAVMSRRRTAGSAACSCLAGDLPAVVPPADRRAAVLGLRCASAPACSPRCAASTPRWSACCWPRSTRRSGPARSRAGRLRDRRWWRSCCSLCGRRRRGWWSSLAPWPPLR